MREGGKEGKCGHVQSPDAEGLWPSTDHTGTELGNERWHPPLSRRHRCDQRTRLRGLLSDVSPPGDPCSPWPGTVSAAASPQARGDYDLGTGNVPRFAPPPMK